MKNIIKNLTLVFCSLLLLGIATLVASFSVYASDGARLGIESCTIEGDVLVPGEEATLHLVVKNYSNVYDAFNALLLLTSNSGKLFPADGSDNQYFIGELGRGQSTEIVAKIRVSSDLDTSVVDLVCTYTVHSLELTASNSSVLVLPVAAGSRANIDIESFSLDTGVLIAGRDSVLRMKIHNLSTTSDAENVVLTLANLSDEVFPAYGTDNQYPIGHMDKDETRTVEIPLSVSNNFYSRDLELVCDFAYTGESGPINNTLYIVLPSTESAPVVIKNIDISTHAVLNSKTLVSITLWNNSSENITDARLLIDGPVSDESREIVLGTLYSQQNYAEDCQVVFNEMGNQAITIRLQYTDLNGELRETELGTYQVTVAKSVEEYHANFSNDILKYIGWGIAAFAVIASLYIFVGYAKKRL
ncbi:MAG: hypothetical protein K5871_06600 [Lachnospiraceae bacterium]|nr:hypothetical protein [Lachnospiraceae bacterium]